MEEPLAPKEKLVHAIQTLQQEVTTLEQKLSTSQKIVARLQKEVERWRLCFDFLEEIVVVVDTKGAISLLNQKGRRLLGFRSPEEYLGRFWHQLCFEPAVGEAVRFLQKKLLEGELEIIKRYQAPVLNRFGRTRIIDWQTFVVRDKEEKVFGLLHYGWETSEKEILPTTTPEANYRVLLDALPVPVHVIDKNYHILFFNQAFQEWNRKLGLRMPEIEQNLFTLFPFLSDKVRKEYQQVFESGEPLITRETTEVADHIYLTETSKIPIMEAGKVEKIMTVVQLMKEI